MFKIFATIFLVLIMFPMKQIEAQDLAGRVLPSSIPQDLHDSLVQGTRDGLKVEHYPHPYWFWVAAGQTVDVQRAEIGRIRSRAPYNSNCNRFSGFDDGVGRGALWKPEAESTGRAVVLDDSEKRDAKFQVFSFAGSEVGSIRRKACCNNGGRMHWFLNESAEELDKHKPLTIRYEYGDIIECKLLFEPTQRTD